MNFVDCLVIGIVVLILGLTVYFVVKSKKKGRKCIGCPSATTCSGCCPGK